jgi:hypothetical protein
MNYNQIVNFFAAFAPAKFFTKIMLPMLKSPTNYGFHELFHNYSFNVLIFNVSSTWYINTHAKKIVLRN